MKRSLVVALLTLSALFVTGPAVQAQLGGKSPEHDERVAKALTDKGVKYTIDKDGDYRVIFETEGKRTQLAFVRSKTYSYGNFEIREIWSVAYSAKGETLPESIANQLLEDTFDKKMGAWAKVGGKVVFIVRIAADSDGESLYNALNHAMTSADAMEKQLTGEKDEF